MASTSSAPTGSAPQQDASDPMELDTPESAAEASVEKTANVIGAIFIPLQEDLTQPFEPPRDRIERLKQILLKVDVHESQVRNNILEIYNNEKKWLIQQARKAEADQGIQGTKPGLTPQEADDMIWNMSVPVRKDANYTNYSVPDAHIMPPHTTQAYSIPPRTPREQLMKQLTHLVEVAVSQLHGYQTHVQNDIRNKYVAALEREVARDAEFGNPPSPKP